MCYLFVWWDCGRLRSTILDQEDNDDDEELLLEFIIGRITKDYIKTT
jgi:hypothetical protein